MGNEFIVLIFFEILLYWYLIIFFYGERYWESYVFNLRMKYIEGVEICSLVW